VGKKSTERHVFLFNDLLVFTRTKKSPKGAAYKYKESVLLHQALVERVDPPLGDYAFKIIIPQVVVYVLIASSRDVAEVWFRELQQVIKVLAPKPRQRSASNA
jgi:hypothetical protein